MNWTSGVLDLNLWQLVLATLALTHVTIVSVTLYLHRHSAHRAIKMHPALAHFFRFWLWLTTGQQTRAWTAIHRKHHARCETEEDPHSPQVLGLPKVLGEGAELYMQEADNEETLRRYGQGCPDDWLERHIYHPHNNLGIALMAVIDLLLFGVAGITIWAIQMIWIPLFAAGIINGVGHYWGYRNFESPDASRNVSPLGLLIGGEELHNNHHTYPNSARLSNRWFEFDLGWGYIRLLRLLGLVQVVSAGPVGYQIEGKRELDAETLLAVVNNRFQIMAMYRRNVLAPVLREELARADASAQRMLKRARKLLSREQAALDDQSRGKVREVLDHHAALRTIYEKRLALQQICARAASNQQERLAALRTWCKEAEASGVRSLEEFASQLRSYALNPVAV